MGLGLKLNFAFFTVILVMVLTHAGYQIFMEYTGARSNARKIVDPAARKLIREIDQIQKRNLDLAGQLEADGTFRQAYTSKDREATAQAIKAFADRAGLPGFVTVIDDKGKVFYSSDTPSKFGYAVKNQSAEIQYVMHHNKWYGAASVSIAGTLAITDMVPVTSGSNVTGIIAVCQPISTEFLTGMQKTLELSGDHLSGVDLALFSLADGKVVAVTPQLMSKDSGFIARLNREGPKAVHSPDVEEGGRIWKPFRLEGANNTLVAYILVTTPFSSSAPRYMAILGQAGVSAGIALFLALLFSAGISGTFNRSMRFLIQRAQDLAAQKKTMPSLEGLSGEWVELAEVIDTAVSSPRSSVKSLQSQMTRHADELEERKKQVETANNQVEAANRQLMVQSRQLSEVSKQINYANAQAIILQQKLAAVLQISTEGFLILDQYGNVLSANPVFQNWSGASEGEIAGRFCFDLVKKPGESRDGGGRGAFSHHKGNPQDLIAQFYPEGIVFHRSQDKAIEVLAHLHPVVTDDSNTQGYIMVLRDKSIHSEVARLRSDILYMLQDSIRVPLIASEQKWAQVLATSAQSFNSTVGNALVDLHAQYQQLLGVVDSLLMMYGGVVPSPAVIRDQISITRLVGDCLEQVSQQARAHQIMLDYKTVTGLPTSALDKDLVRDIIVQLLEKLISVTAPGGRVRVESAAKGSEIRLSISSSGPALPQAEIEDMFAGFIQGKHAEDSYSSRLSLYLVRNNVERIGGRVWAESDRGTTIYFTLPVH